MKRLFLLSRVNMSTALAILAFLAFVIALIIGFNLFPTYQKFSKFLSKYNLTFPWTSPNTKWEMATPESMGVDGRRLNLFKDDLIARKTRALLLVRKDKIILEWYAPGYGPNTLHGTASLAKVLAGSMLLLLVLGDGRIVIDDPAWNYIPAWKDHPFKSNITIRHLITHTSGIEDANEPGKPKEELTEWKGTYWRNLSERFPIAITKAPVIFPPGSRYAYSNPGAKVGQLMLNRGEWKGKQLLDPVLVDRALSSFGGGPEVEIPLGHPEPGFYWWVNSNGALTSLPHDAFIAAGGGHQILLVVPSLELVLVRFGGSLGSGQLPGLGGAFWRNLENYLFRPLMDILGNRSSRVGMSKVFDAQKEMIQLIISEKQMKCSIRYFNI
ncbi:MAG TPA: serine hydrolase domain-containing protein [Thermodesulfobacteriota bacterium]|nr:serine hydrolase domain-containing protein [Thermodesulfobacteriota bacterium]